MKKLILLSLILSFVILLTASIACDNGDQVPVIIDGKAVMIDRCIAPIVDALNKGGIKTISSCCGHGREDGYIWCEEVLIIIAKERGKKEVRGRYNKDFEGMARRNEQRTQQIIKRKPE